MYMDKVAIIINVHPKLQKEWFRVKSHTTKLSLQLRLWQKKTRDLGLLATYIKQFYSQPKERKVAKGYTSALKAK